MPDLANQPEGSSITIRTHFQDTILSWKARGKSGKNNWLITAFVLSWLVAWAVGEVIVLLRLKHSLWSGGLSLPATSVAWRGLIYDLAWLGGWSIAGLLVIQALGFSLFANRPESITLSAGEFRYDPGASASSRSRRSMTGSITMPRGRIPQFNLDRVGTRQRLSFDHNADRIEIGKKLREPDREWLANVLDHWRRS